MENGTGALAATRPVTWQVEYPGQDPEAEKDKMVWEIQVSERDVRALVPLVKVRPETWCFFFSRIACSTDPYTIPLTLSRSRKL